MGRLTTKNFRPTRSVKQIKESMLLEMYDKLAHYEDMEEHGRLIEQKHGRWIHKDNFIGKYLMCSECSCVTSRKSNYCPNCGAKLEESKGE